MRAVSYSAEPGMQVAESNKRARKNQSVWQSWAFPRVI